MDFSGNGRTRQARKPISAVIDLVSILVLVIAVMCTVAGAASGLEADPIPKPPYRLYLSNTVQNSDLAPPTSQPGEHGVAWVYPVEANVGETVRLGGFGFGTEASQVVVWFSFWGKRAQGKVVSVQNGEISVVVPYASLGVHNGGGAGWSVEVFIGGRPMAQNQGPSLTVRNIPAGPPDLEPAIPDPWYNSYPDHNYLGAIGDVVEIVGHGFSLEPAQNVINFGGATGASARVTAVHFIPNSTYYQIATLTIPEGARTGPISAARLDGIAGEWGESQSYTIISPMDVFLSSTTEAEGLLAPYFITDAGLPTQFREQGSHTWIIEGKNLSKLQAVKATLTTSKGVYTTDNLAVLSDTRAVIHADRFVIETVLDGLAAGTPVKLRFNGLEPGTNLTRQSNEITIPFGGQPVAGSVWKVSPYLDTPRNPFEVPKGDWLCLDHNQALETPQTLRAEGLWSGPLTFGSKYSPPYDLAWGRCTLLSEARTFTITNETNGRILQVTVKDEGVPGGVTTNRCGAVRDGVTIGFGGARLIIPPGALPDYGCYLILGGRQARTLSLFDPEQTDGGYEFRVYLGYGANGNTPLNQLLKPVQLILPYSDQGRGSPPTASVLDTTSGVYLVISDAVVDSVNHRVTLTVPAGTYGTALTSNPGALSAPGPTSGFPTQAPLATALGHVGVVSTATAPCTPLEDPDKFFKVEYTCDPASSSYATTAFADEVLNNAVATYKKLKGQSWRLLPGQQSITIRDLGPWTPTKGTGGATTKGVFGQPWVYLNNKITRGDHLAVTTAHEVGHAFQRQYTTNVTTKWIDEAAAGWVAWEATKNVAGMKPVIEGGIQFVEKSIPAGFGSGYDTEEAYSAAALTIWMGDIFPNSVRRMYEAIDACWTSLCWDDTYGILKTATGQDIRDLSKDFFLGFWRQSFNPMSGVAVPVRDQRFSVLPGSTASAAPPRYSSIAWKMGPNDALYPTVKARTYVLRVRNLDPSTQTLYILGEQTPVPSGGLPLIKEFKLPPSTQVWISGVVGDLQTYRNYRAVLVNHGTNTPTVNVELVTPDITSVSPLSVPKSGGTTVTIYGGGFGTRPGQVIIDNGTYTVTTFTNWTDTGVSFTMPNMGTRTGQINVQLKTLESDNTQAESNIKTITLY